MVSIYLSIYPLYPSFWFQRKQAFMISSVMIYQWEREEDNKELLASIIIEASCLLRQLLACYQELGDSRSEVPWREKRERREESPPPHLSTIRQQQFVSKNLAIMTFGEVYLYLKFYICIMFHYLCSYIFFVVDFIFCY